MPIMTSDDKDSQKTFFSNSSHSSYNFLSEQELEYMNLIQNQIQPYFPRFAAALAEQSPLEREEGRCAVVDFTGQQGRQINSFSIATELDQYLVDSSPPPYSSGDSLPRRRLFILEDLPCNYILALGSRLRIPPSFFAGHWEDPATSTFNHRSPFQKCSLPHFRLRYGTSNRVEIDPPDSSNNNVGVLAFNTRVCRYLHMYNRNGLLYDEARSHHALSFWSSSVCEDGSWDAVLLVDPAPKEFVKCTTSRKLLPLRTRLADETSMPKYFLNPEIDVLQDLPSDCSQWAAAYSSPTYVSMFDDTLQSFHSPNANIIATHDPLSVTDIPRRLVISISIAFTRRRYLNLVSIQNSVSRSQAMRHNYLSSFSKSNYSSWSSELFDFIVGSRAAIKEFGREMEDNAVALGVDRPDSASPKWEIDGWRSIRDFTGVVEDTVDAFAAGYLQYVTIQEAHVSNSTAQSLSRITVLTMLFIPLSTVASIFSMGEGFLPGQNNSWVFWVVALPILAILSYLYWYQQLVRIWQGKKKQILPMFEKRLVKT